MTEVQYHAQHRLIAIENKFTAGTNATGGKFTQTISGLGFIPDIYVVRSIAYDGADNIAGPLLISCAQFGGPIGTFISKSSQGDPSTNNASPEISTPGSTITNIAGVDISGQLLEFSVTQRGIGQSLLSGSLMIVIECIKRRLVDEKKR